MQTKENAVAVQTSDGVAGPGTESISAPTLPPDSAAVNPFMSVAEAARLVGVNYVTFRNWCKQGQVPCYATSCGPNAHLLIHRGEFERWLREGRR